MIYVCWLALTVAANLTQHTTKAAVQRHLNTMDETNNTPAVTDTAVTETAAPAVAETPKFDVNRVETTIVIGSTTFELSLHPPKGKGSAALAPVPVYNLGFIHKLVDAFGEENVCRLIFTGVVKPIFSEAYADSIELDANEEPVVNPVKLASNAVDGWNPSSRKKGEAEKIRTQIAELRTQLEQLMPVLTKAVATNAPHAEVEAITNKAMQLTLKVQELNAKLPSTPKTGKRKTPAKK